MPVFILGLSWYIRNYLLTGNPFYPQSFLFFPGLKSTILDVSVLDIINGSLSGLIGTLNAFVSEFIVWAFIIPFVIFSLFKGFTQNKSVILPKELIVVSILISALMLNLPSSNETHIMTSSFRYFYASITIFILLSFIFFIKKNQMVEIIIISLCSILLIDFPQGFYPKLILLIAPIALYIYSRGYRDISRIAKRIGN